MTPRNLVRADSISSRDGVRAPGWAATLQPAVDRVRANLDTLLRTPTPGESRGRPCAAEDLIDAAEAWAARDEDPYRRRDLLEIARLLRRVDQSVLTLAGAPPVAPSPAAKQV